MDVTLESSRLFFTGVELQNPHRLTLCPGINVVIGPNGSGKSTLGKIIERGWNFRTNRILSSSGERPAVRRIEFSDIHSLSGMKVEYYQQRYEATMNDEVPTVAEALGSAVGTERWRELTSLFSLVGAEAKRLNYLSSGELRKLLIINSLIEPTDILILDNPYIGLDAASRLTLDEAVSNLARSGMTILMLVANRADIHPSTRCIVPMSRMEILPALTADDYPGRLMEEADTKLAPLFSFDVDLADIPEPPVPDTEPLRNVLSLDRCRVNYAGHTIIDGISWSVADCSFHLLTGPNGSGKSTLLSLICADNPQAYSNHIILFDRRRGSGESIWDIKRRISFISPELSLHFHPAGDVATIIAQGLNDTSGIYVPVKPEQRRLADLWMRLLHIRYLSDRSFTTLSSGERQMVLLARTFIKQPRLMILDEPMHGLDSARRAAVGRIIDYFAARAVAWPDRFPMAMIFVSHYAEETPACITHTISLAPTSHPATSTSI